MTVTTEGSVLFDSQVFANQWHGGVSRYFNALMTSLSKRGHWQPLLHAGIHFAQTVGAADAKRVGLNVHVPMRRPRGIRYAQALNRHLSPSPDRLDRDSLVYHPTWYDAELARKYRGIPMVTTIHDLMPERWPELSSPQQLAGRSQAIRDAHRIVCVSESTRTQLAEWYPESEHKATTVHLGVPDYVLAQPLKAEPGRVVDARYFVYVGKRGHYKNFATLAEAMLLIDSTISLVMIGGRTATEATGPLRKLIDARRVTHVPSPNDSELAALLQGASALVSPSFEEGFGLPPLEALALGTSVVLSDIAVYRELYSDWAQFFQPSDVETLAALLVRAAEGTLPTHDPQVVRSRFSWDQTAAKTEAIYSQAMDCWEESGHRR